MILIALAAALTVLVGAAAALVILLDDDHLGSRIALVPLTIYCAMAEVNMAPLAGAAADKAFDVLLALMALVTVAFLWWRDRPPVDELLGQPAGWLLMLFGSGLLLSPFSLAPFVSVLRTTVALALVAMAAILTRRYGFVHTLAAAGLGATLLVVMGLAWEIAGPGTPPVEQNGFILDSGFFGLPRHAGVTATANQFGRVAATAVVAGALILRARPWARFGWLFQAIGLLGLFYAQSRTAIIVGVAFLLIAHARSGRALGIATLVVLVGAASLWLTAAGVLGVDSVTRRNGGTEELTTATGRTALWGVVWDLSWDRPLSGQGAFATHSAIAPAVEDGRVAFPADDAHDLYLNIFLSQGLFGVGILTAFAVSSAAALRRRLPGTAGAGVMLATIAGLGLTETPIWKPNSTLVMAAVAAGGLTSWRTAAAKVAAVQPAMAQVSPAVRARWASVNRQASRQISSSPR